MSTTCGRLLIAEDEPILRIALADALRKEGWEVSVAEDGAAALQLFQQQAHDVVLADLLMPRMDGIQLLQQIKVLQSGTTFVIITAHGTVDTAVEAMRLGAADFITKPFSVAQLLLRLESVCSIRLLKEQNIRLQAQLEQRFSFGKIVGKSKKMQEVFELIRVVASSEASVLIQGESGTGKELVASAIHFNSQRRAGPCVRVSCASLPESLVESELFGYERGAFTGATERRVGRFEGAHGGTLFLDEIGELPLSFQVKLLRVLQERKVERLGSHKSHEIDVRIIAASLRPLEEEIAQGRFREDLFFRVNTVAIRLPPLRERPEDIPLLSEVFLEELSREQQKAIRGFDQGVLEIFDDHPWPGNVRELRNVIERSVLFCNGGRITRDHLPASIRTPAPGPAGSPSGVRQVVPLDQVVKRAEVEAIRIALQAAHGKRGEAADLLGVSRKTLWEKMKQHGLSSDD
jgi:two-component system, NtrC family, response regulator PilR